MTAGFDTLVSTLGRVAQRNGLKIDLDALCAALGHPFMVCAAGDCSCLRWWADVARDAFIVDVGPWFGMSVRGMQPPSTLCGMQASSEFEQHFAAGYKPLIAEFLDHNQPVIGWFPEEDRNAAPMWRLICGATDEGIGLTASSLDCPESGEGEADVVLIRPPVQVYVIEKVEPAAPDPAELVSLVLKNATLVLNDKISADLGVTSGPAVLDAWIDRLGGEAVCGECQASISECHRSLAECVIEGQRSLARFVDNHRELAAEADRGVLDCLRESGAGMIDALTESIELGSAETWTPADLKNVRQSLANTRAAAKTALTALLSWSRTKSVLT